MATAPYELEFLDETDEASCLTVRFPKFGPGSEAWVLVQSDQHVDHPQCDHALLRKHLKLADQREAIGLSIGDFFDCIGGKFDPRRSMSALRPELRRDDYLTVVPKYCANVIRPYGHIYKLWTPGNHCQSIMDHHQVDLLRALVKELEPDSRGCHIGSMRGWVRFCFHLTKTVQDVKVLHYIHGYGGGGPVTKDTIQLDRQMTWVEGADIILSGHTHDQWHIPVARAGLNREGRPVERIVECLKIGTYQTSFKTGRGYNALKGHGPKPKGAWWIKFSFAGDEVEMDVTRAK